MSNDNTIEAWAAEKHEMSNDNTIDTWAAVEYREGVSPGAAARQLCRSLGSNGVAPCLKELLEDMLADALRASFDRSQILIDFADADPEAAAEAYAASFARNNPSADQAEVENTH